MTFDGKFDGQFLNAFLFAQSSRGDICVNVMLKVLVMLVAVFGLSGITIPLAAAGEIIDYVDDEQIVRSREAARRFLPVNSINEYQIGVQIGAIIQVPDVIEQAIQINFGDLEGFEELPIFRTPKIVHGLQFLEYPDLI